MAIHDELVSILANYRKPVRAELVSMLVAPQRRLVRCLHERASQLEVFENEYADLVEFAQVHSIPNFGRF